MRRLIGWGMRLYPAQWRARYGEEFLALVEDARVSGRDVWDVLRGALLMQFTSLSFTKIVAAFTVAGVLAAGVWSLMLPDRYVSTSVLRIGAGLSRQELVQAMHTATSPESLTRIVEREDLYPAERKRVPLDEVIQKMRQQDVRIVSQGDSQGTGFTVEFSYRDPTSAQKAAGDLVAALTAAAPSIEVVEPARLPNRPDGPNRGGVVLRGLAAGLVVGLLGGGVLAILRHRSGWSMKRVGAYAAAGMILGGTNAFLMPDEFISNAVMRVEDQSKLQPAVERAVDPAALADIVRKYDLYHRELSNGPVEGVVAGMRQKDIRVQVVHVVAGSHPGAAFMISFRYPDRFKAQMVTRDLMAGS